MDIKFQGYRAQRRANAIVRTHARAVRGANRQAALAAVAWKLRRLARLG